MKEQLKKIFSDPKFFISDTKSEPYIKVESPDSTSPTYYQKGNFNRGSYRGRFNKTNSFRIVMLAVTIGILTENLEKQTLPTRMVRLPDVTFVGRFTIGKSLV